MLSQEADAKKGASKTAKSLNFGKGTPIRGLGRRDGEQLDLVIEMEGKRHDYFIFVPKISAEGAPAPMLVLLHGSGHDGPWTTCLEIGHVSPQYADRPCCSRHSGHPR